MAEAAGVALGVLAVVGPAFEACRSVYQGCKITEFFGSDFRKAQRKLECQTAILEELAKLKVSALLGNSDQQSKYVNQVVQILVDMKDDFRSCEELIKKYQPGTATDGGYESDCTETTYVEAADIVPEKRTLSRKSSETTLNKSKFNRIFKRDTSSTPTNTSDSAPQIFDAPSVQSAEIQSSNEAQRLDRTSRLFQRATWAFQDKQAFYRYLDDLEHSNRTLQSLIQIRFLAEKSFLQKKEKPEVKQGQAAATATRAVRLTDETVVCQEVLHNLQSDLSAVSGSNPASKPDIVVKLYLNHDKTRNELDSYPEMTVRDGSLVFLVQVHEHQNKTDSALLVVDTPSLISRRKKSLAYRAANMDYLRNQREARGMLITDIVSTIRQMDSDALDQFVFLGHISSRSLVTYGDDKPPSPATRQLSDAEKEAAVSLLRKPVLHHIYQDQFSAWTVSTTLADLLQDSRYRQITYTLHRISLAILLANSYISFGFEGRPRVFRPQDCRYYKPLGDKEAAESKQFILSPYLRLQGGQQRKRIGLSSGSATDTDTARIELGLLLYQIGCWTHLDYDHPNGLQALAFETRSKINDVIRHSGSKFASVVDYCLQLRHSTERVTVAVPAEDFDLWPMFGRRDDASKIDNFLQGPGKGMASFTMTNIISANLNLEIYNKVVIPLQELEERMWHVFE